VLGGGPIVGLRQDSVECGADLLGAGAGEADTLGHARVDGLLGDDRRSSRIGASRSGMLW